MRELLRKLKLKFQTYFFQFYTKNQLSDAFEDACKSGQLEVIRYLLTSDICNQHKDTYHFNDGFLYACESGKLEVIRYLLTSDICNQHKDIYNLNRGFKCAWVNGHLDVVKYLLTSPELTEHANINARYGTINTPYSTEFLWGMSKSCFDWVGTKCDWNAMEYLLTFSGVQYINFQKTKYTLDWAIEKQYHNIVKAMITSLYKNDMIGYLENVSEVEQYCLDNGLDLKAWQEDIVKEDVNLNSQTTELFI